MDPLTDYRYQPLPNLSSSRLPDERSRYEITLPFQLQLERGKHDDTKERLKVFARVAFARILLLYLDSLDFLFAEVPEVDPTRVFDLSHLRPVRIRLDELEGKQARNAISWADIATRTERVLSSNDNTSIDLGRIKEQLGLNSDSEQFSFPSIFLWDWALNGGSDSTDASATGVPSTYAALVRERTLIIGLSASPESVHNGRPEYALHASSNGSIMSESMLSTFIHQVHSVLQTIFRTPDAPYTSPLDVLTTPIPSYTGVKSPPPLFSEYTSPDFLSHLDAAATPLKWLIKTANAHPDRLAHEIYEVDAFSNSLPPTTPSPEDGRNNDESLDPLIPTSTLTYGRLNALSNAFAAWLGRPQSDQDGATPKTGGGIRKGDMVCVCLERTAGFYIAQAAIWKIGAIYVPVSPTSLAIPP